MAHTPTHDTLILTTPRGHEVVAELDYENFAVSRARVVHTHTGVIKPLDNEISENLARALRAKQVYEHALQETKLVEQTLNGFGEAVMALGKRHPAVQPYWTEAEQHRAIARDMHTQAQNFHNDAMSAIDKLAED